MDVSGEKFGPVQPVAIVGVALRFPGALDPLSFHHLTLSRKRLFQLGYGPGRRGITPCHTLAAEAAAAAMADARLDRDWGRRSSLAKQGRSGVIVANCPSLATVSTPMAPPIGPWVGQRLGLAEPVPTGQWPAQEMAPTMVCSLRAVAFACEALNRGEFDLMLAGGVAVGIGGEARKRDIRVYDAHPTGIAPGEGCGMVALMRAADARAAGLPAYAEIAGWSTAEDGPDLRAVIRAAYPRAGIDPVDVQLVEGHGAATADDDQAELAALLDVLDQADGAASCLAGRDGARGGCALGSVAANLGDTRGAAGVAALLKTSLAMTAATIPPTTGCVEPHELLRERDAIFRLPRTAEEWPDTRTQLAAVNSLGAATSGTGRSGPTHLVLRREQDARGPGRRRRVSGARGVPPQGLAPREAAGVPRSCPIRQPAPELGRPRHVLVPRPRPPQDVQRARQPLAESLPAIGCQPAPQRALASARGEQGGAPQPAWAAKDDALDRVREAGVSGVTEAADVTGAGSGGSGAFVQQGPTGQAGPRPDQPAEPYLRVRQLLALQSAAIIGRLAAAMATTRAPGQEPALPPVAPPGPVASGCDPDAALPDPAATTPGPVATGCDPAGVLPGRAATPPGPVATGETPAPDSARRQPQGEPRPPAQATKPSPVMRRLSVRERSDGAAMIVAVRGRDRADLIAQLEEVAVRAPHPSGPWPRGFAPDRPAPGGATAPACAFPGAAAPVAAAVTASPPATGRLADGGARAALVGGDPAELMALAGRAAEILRFSGPGPVRSWPRRDRARPTAPGGLPATPGVYLSEGARGRVALVFGGLAWTSAEHVSTLSTSAATIAWAQRMGIDAHVAAAFGVGEIIGLAWAQAITHDEAARLAALRAEILRSVAGLTSMARVHADHETTARLLAGTQLVRAVDEGPTQQVVAGPLPSVQALPHLAAGLGVDVELLNATCGLHSGDMWPCVPPMAAIAAGTPIGPLRRRLISSVTGIDFALSGAPADLLARQLERPALLASAISLASADADLVLLATPEGALAGAAMSCCRVPVLLPPPDASSDPAPEALATLFTAGLADDGWPAPAPLPGTGRVPVAEQAPAMYRVPRPSLDWDASLTVR